MRTQIASMFLCLLVGLATAQAQLKVDFGVTGGTAAVEPGYQGYFATDKNAATFTAQSYTAFGTTVTIKPSFAPGAAAAGMRAIDRGTDDGIVDAVNLLRDWIGWDTRQVGDPMTLTISGLPAGVYQWLSYHHDAHDQTGIFSVTVNDAAGSTTTTGIDISNTTGSTVKTLADATKFTTRITSNGKDNVTLVFHQTSASSVVANAIFVINGFELTSLETEAAAIAPIPTPGATDVPRDGTILSWIPNKKAVAHGVYLGTDYDDIDDGTTASAVYKGRQDANSFDPGRLELGQTYYWRVDEILADGQVVKGNVWSFTVEPVSIALTAGQIKATASSSNSANEGPEKTIDGSGLSADDKHSMDTVQMWLSAATLSGPVWIQYDFDKLYQLHQMLVWNHNSAVESLVGLGVKDVTIAYSQDGVDWTTLGTTHEIAQAPEAADYVANTTIDFGGVAAKHVKISINSNWGGILPQYGLSEVRFMVIPVGARQPVPASGATGMDPRVPLTWRAGREAATHRVYISTDANEVRNGAVLVGTVSQPLFDASKTLALGKTYYWKVDDVNDRDAQTVWEGDVWSFTVQQYLVVDDFESYTNDSPRRVFQTWIDGMGFSEDEHFPKGNPGNGSGALVGYDPTAGNIMELVSFHGGVQSMPLAYDSSAAAYSEAERTFDPPQDWTAFGVKALTLWFQGAPTNTASTLYVKVNGCKVAYDGDAGNLLSKPWHLWYIPLTSFTGVDLKKVAKLAIGFEGGTGLVFIDDISLSPLDRQLVTPATPVATNLVAHYTFEGNANDSVGGHNGTVGGAPTFVAGKVGQAIKLNGAQDYVLVQGTFDLPVFTAALWFRVEGGTGNRALLSIFNDAALHGALLEVASTGGLRFLYRTPVGVATGDINIRDNDKFDDGTWYHVAIVKSADSVTLYINGEPAGSAASTTQFDQALTKMTLGMLKYPIDTADPRYLPGQIDDVYLYGRALSAGEVASIAGRTKPFDKQ